MWKCQQAADWPDKQSALCRSPGVRPPASADPRIYASRARCPSRPFALSSDTSHIDYYSWSTCNQTVWSLCVGPDLMTRLLSSR